MTIYFDENFPHQLAQALNLLDNQNNILSTIENYKGKKDIELIPEISQKNGILITRDKKMRKFNAEKELLIQYNMIVIFYEGSHSNYWDIVRLFVKNWEKITNELRKIKQGPYFLKMNVNGKIENIQT